MSDFLLKFDHEGRSAALTVVDGVVQYEGDLPVAQSAQMLFDAWGQLVAEAAPAECMGDKGVNNYPPRMQ